MTEFQREERFIVVKRKHIADPEMEKRFRLYIKNYLGVETVECVVVESDWPEYETVWKMIEARVSGNPAMTDTQALIERLMTLAAKFDGQGGKIYTAELFTKCATALTEAEAKLAKAREALQACHDKMHECTAVLSARDCADVAATMASARACLAELGGV